MKSLLKLSLASLLVSFFSASFACAYSVDYSATNNPVYSADSIGSWTTDGADMAGMEVTVYYANGVTDVATWAATGSTSGSAVGNGWSLTVLNDTYQYSWKLLGTDILGFSINGTTGDTVFDRTFGGADGTTNSESGVDLTVYSTGLGTIDVSYSSAVALSGTSAVGDLFALLTVYFYDEYDQALGLDEFRFKQDTDNSVGHLNPTPEPLSMLLFGTGLAGFLGIRRKRH